MKKIAILLICISLLLSGCKAYDDSEAYIEFENTPSTTPDLNESENKNEPEPVTDTEPEPALEPEMDSEAEQTVTETDAKAENTLTLPPATEAKTYNNKDAYVVGFTDDLMVLRPQSATYESYIVIEIDTTDMDLIKNEIVYITGTAEPLETPMPFPNDNGKYPIRYTMDKNCIVSRQFNAQNINTTEEIIYIEKDFIVFTFAKRNIKVYCDADEYCVGDSARFEGKAEKIEPETITLSNGKQKKITYQIKNATVTSSEDFIIAKPVIYLYPKAETNVSVSLDLNGKLTCTYPDYNGLWQVTARPDGTLTDKAGREYYCLYWEGESAQSYLPSDNVGFMVKGEDTAEFLREKALALGLTQKEANEFIIYWLPLMQNNAYNYVYFSIDEYADAAKLNVTPAPNTVIRFSMVWKGLDSPYDVTEQILPEAPVRHGFTVVEWGGIEIK